MLQIFSGILFVGLIVFGTGLVRAENDGVVEHDHKRSGYTLRERHALKKLPDVEISGVGEQIINRNSWATKGIDQKSNCLEIAPLCMALLQQGPHTKNLDVQSREANIKKYDTKDSWPQAVLGPKWKDHFVEVHYIWHGEPYSELIKSEKFDFIVGSHVIEHIPDFISWLNDLEKLLTANGEIRMIVPDMRFNWDHQRKPTDLSDIVGNYLEGRKRPGWDVYFEQVLLAPISANRNATELWDSVPRQYGDSYVHTLDTNILKTALAGVTGAKQRTEQTKSYEDAHVNRWSPAAFFYQMSDLRRMGLINLKVVNLVPTQPDSAEFFVALKKDPIA